MEKQLMEVLEIAHKNPTPLEPRTFIAFVELWPTADRIALARKLLAGTGVKIIQTGAGDECPFDREDHGGLAPEDHCPVCGEDGFNVPENCISPRWRR